MLSRFREIPFECPFEPPRASRPVAMLTEHLDGRITSTKNPGKDLWEYLQESHWQNNSSPRQGQKVVRIQHLAIGDHENFRFGHMRASTIAR